MLVTEPVDLRDTPNGAAAGTGFAVAESVEGPVGRSLTLLAALVADAGGSSIRAVPDGGAVGLSLTLLNAVMLTPGPLAGAEENEPASCRRGFEVLDFVVTATDDFIGCLVAPEPNPGSFTAPAPAPKTALLFSGRVELDTAGADGRGGSGRAGPGGLRGVADSAESRFGAVIAGGVNPTPTTTTSNATAVNTSYLYDMSSVTSRTANVDIYCINYHD